MFAEDVTEEKTRFADKIYLNIFGEQLLVLLDVFRPGKIFAAKLVFGSSLVFDAGSSTRCKIDDLSGRAA